MSKKISFVLNPEWSKYFLENLIKEYGFEIDTIYVPLIYRTPSRRLLFHQMYSPITTNYVQTISIQKVYRDNFLEILNFLKASGFKLAALIDNDNLTEKDLDFAIATISENGLDTVVTSDSYIEYLYSHMPDTTYIRSVFLSEDVPEKYIDIYSKYIISQNAAWQDKLTDKHIQYISMACPMSCRGCSYSINCYDDFNCGLEIYRELRRTSVESYLAKHIITGTDLKYFEDKLQYSNSYILNSIDIQDASFLMWVDFLLHKESSDMTISIINSCLKDIYNRGPIHKIPVNIFDFDMQKFLQEKNLLYNDGK